MTQASFKTDILQIEPGSGQTLTIDRLSSTGAMRFKDVLVPGGLLLSELAGLGTVTGVLVVGRAGTGAKYTTLQSAVDAVPVSSSLTNPYVILMFPGVYTENVTIEKAGITILGLGRVVLQNSAAAATIVVQDAVASFPTSLTLKGMVIVQTEDSLACVSLVGGAGSTVGTDGIILDACDIRPTGVGGYTVYANAVNTIILQDCRSDGVPATASLRVAQCASVSVRGGGMPLVQMDYSSAGTIPSVSGSAYSIVGCDSAGNTLSTLSGAGSLSIKGCSAVGTLTMNGNRTLTVVGSAVGNVTLNGTTTATFKTSSRGTLAGAGTLSEEQTVGTVGFVGSASEAVVFGAPRPNANYAVSLETLVYTTSKVSNKLATGFTVEFSAPETTTVSWTVTS